MAARMIAETRMGGTIDQIDGVVYFKSKPLATYSVLQIHLSDIVTLMGVMYLSMFA